MPENWYPDVFGVTGFKSGIKMLKFKLFKKKLNKKLQADLAEIGNQIKIKIFMMYYKIYPETETNRKNILNLFRFISKTFHPTNH